MTTSDDQISCLSLILIGSTGSIELGSSCKNMPWQHDWCATGRSSACRKGWFDFEDTRSRAQKPRG